ncbi:MAG: hypothetical protein M1570_07645 [Chloroflexi bacterium]|nr:hypothetical protein [Chloroflexota bacterium]
MASVVTGSLALAYVSYWKKNVYLAMILHGGMNFAFMLLPFMALLAK